MPENVTHFFRLISDVLQLATAMLYIIVIISVLNAIIGILNFDDENND